MQEFEQADAAYPHDVIRAFDAIFPLLPRNVTVEFLRNAGGGAMYEGFLYKEGRQIKNCAKMMNFALKARNFVSKSRKSEELFIKNEEFCIQNDGFCREQAVLCTLAEDGAPADG